MIFDYSDGIKLKGVLECYARKIGGEWKRLFKTHNLVPYDGKHLIVKTLMNTETQYFNKNTAYFVWSNGVNEPSNLDTVQDFLNDGDHGYKKVVNVKYLSDERKIKTEMYMNSLDGNDVGTITKLCLTNKEPVTPYGRLYMLTKFDAITKTSEKELYFIHYLEFV